MTQSSISQSRQSSLIQSNTENLGIRILDKIISFAYEVSDLETMLNLTLNAIVSGLKVDAAELMFVDSGQLQHQSSVGLSVDFHRRTRSILENERQTIPYQWLISSASKVWQIDLNNPKYTDDNYVQIAKEVGFQTVTCIQLVDSTQVRGLLILYRTGSDQPVTDADTWSTIGRQLIFAVEKINLEAANQKIEYDRQVLNHLNHQLITSDGMQNTFKLILEHMAQVIDFSSAAISLVQGGFLYPIQYTGYERFNAGAANKLEQVSFDINLTPHLKQLVDSNKPFIIDDVRQYSGWLEIPDFDHVRSFAAIPLIDHGTVFAIVFLDHIHPGHFKDAHIQIASDICMRAGLALQLDRAIEENRRQIGRLNDINEISRNLTGLFSIRDVCVTATSQICTRFQFTSVSILVRDPNSDELIIQGTAGRTQKLLTLGKSVTDNKAINNAIKSQNAVMGSNTWPADNTPEAKPTGKRLADAIIPLRVGTDTFGLIVVEAPQNQLYGSSDLTIMVSFANQVAVVLKSTELLEASHQQVNELETLYEISTALREAGTLDQFSDVLVKRACSSMTSSGSSLMRRNMDTGDLHVLATEPHQPSSIGAIYPKGRGIVGHVAENNQIYVAEDVPSDPLTFRPREDAKRFTGARTSISIPLRSQDKLIGILNVWYRNTHKFSNTEIRFLGAFAEIAGNALQRILILETLEQRISERTQELASANERLTELDKLKSRFVSDVSHELRTPIANLTLYLDLMRRRPDKSEEYAKVLTLQAKRLEELVSNTLSLSRLDLRGADIELKSIDIGQAVSDAIDRHAARAAEREIRLVTQIADNLPAVRGERAQLDQMLHRLIQNAIQYSKPNGLVVVSVKTNQIDHVVLEFSDQGVGIDEEDLAHIFQRFYRSGRVTHIPGSGLGLAIVDEIVKMHNGRISVESQLDIGTKIVVQLPIYQDQS